MKKSRLDLILLWLGRGQFFTYSAMLHVLLIALLGTAVMTRVAPKDASMIGEIIGGTPQPPPETERVRPKPDEGNEGSETDEIDFSTRGIDLSPNDPDPRLKDIILSDKGKFQVPNPNPPAFLDKPIFFPGGCKLPQGPAPGSSHSGPGAPMTPEMADTIYDVVDGWTEGNGNPFGQARYKFQAHVAQYAGGDWDSAHEVRDGKIARGAMVNLAWVMKTWTRDKVNAKLSVEPLDLANAELLDEMPPFIFFSGSRDFRLNDEEIDTLRKYILMGGAIWGDSSLPGTNSRFDIAFRREMKRVVGDVSVMWEELPAQHQVFKMKYNLDGPPKGLNHYAEPVYVMRPIAGEISILYTANDYGNMMEIGLNEEGEIDFRRDARHRYVAINEHIWHHREIYFRNIDEESLTATYEFGVNMVYYLLTRWEDEIRRFR